MTKKVKVELSEIYGSKYDIDGKLRIYGTLGYQTTNGSPVTLWATTSDNCLVLGDHAYSHWLGVSNEIELMEGEAIRIGGFLLEHDIVLAPSDMGVRWRQVTYNDIPCIENEIRFDEHEGLEAKLTFSVTEI
ncbi:hypothetical protein [Bacillus cereus]|uniref:hypothetical protein n=1 Tax=Bacillus cereus TaxID=1396 RepID=UPI0013D7B1CD|nr:hypothetical protein [Bacillus cereus]